MPKFKRILGISDVDSAKKIDTLWRALLAEFIGNFMLNFFGCASVVFVTTFNADFTLIPLTFGLTVFLVVQTIGHVSGGHINPAVTFAMMAIREISVIKGLLYVIVQCLGSIAGSATLMALTPDDWQKGGLGITTLPTHVKPEQAFGLEFFLGFLLIFVICGFCDPNKSETKSTGPLAIGVAVAVGHMAFVKFTGSSMNPARSFGSAVVAGVWDDHWVYWVGPILGGIVAALLYVNTLKAPQLTTAKVIERYTNIRDEKELTRLDGNRDNDNFA